MTVIDVLAARYGWLPEQISGVHWSIADTAIKRQADDYRIKYETAALTAFLLGAAGDSKKNFLQFQQDVGLIKKPIKPVKSEAELIEWGEKVYQKYLKKRAGNETV